MLGIEKRSSSKTEVPYVVDEQHLKRVSVQTAHGFLLVLTTPLKKVIPVKNSTTIIEL
jgi:hypothetical protein